MKILTGVFQSGIRRLGVRENYISNGGKKIYIRMGIFKKLQNFRLQRKICVNSNWLHEK